MAVRRLSQIQGNIVHQIFDSSVIVLPVLVFIIGVIAQRQIHQDPRLVQVKGEVSVGVSYNPLRQGKHLVRKITGLDVCILASACFIQFLIGHLCPGSRDHRCDDAVILELICHVLQGTVPVRIVRFTACIRQYK